MVEASFVLFKVNFFLRLSIDSCRVWFTNLQTHTQEMLFVSKIFVTSSVEMLTSLVDMVIVEVLRAVVVVIVVVAGEHETLLDGVLLLENKHVEHSKTFV